MLFAALIGLTAGVAGGLAGIGGSLIMLPGLHLLFGEPRPQVHHTYMAAAVAVNVAVALPAAWQHHRAGAVQLHLVRVLLPLTIVSVVAGVLVSNLVPGRELRYALAGFVALYCLWNIVRIVRPRAAQDPVGGPPRPSTWRLVVTAVATGILAGLLGLGGGLIMVPMLQLVCGIRLRQSIATSSAIICVTSAIAAVTKLSSLHTVGEPIAPALWYAASMAPTAVIGGVIGARLAHALPVRIVRLAITFVLLAAAAKLADFF